MQSQPLDLVPGRAFDRVVCDPWTSGRVRVRYVADDQVFVDELLGGVWTPVARPFALATFLHCWRADFRPESGRLDTLEVAAVESGLSNFAAAGVVAQASLPGGVHPSPFTTR